MQHELPSLPYTKDALAPYISAETLTYHHDKHHRSYVTKLNELIKETKFEYMGLEEIILTANGEIFNNAAQAWNHTFFWNCLSPKGGGEPQGKIAAAITANWDSFEKFKTDFSESAISNFGSGWTWLVESKTGPLEILNTSNADTPKKHGFKALMTLDIWEHAYYIDYRNERPKFVEAFWNVLNWDYVQKQLS